MSTAIADVRAEVAALRKQTKGALPAQSSNNISTAGKKFTLPDGTVADGPLNAVILDWRNFNAYYTKAYDPKNPAGPSCFAIAFNMNDLEPHEQAPEPQDQLEGQPGGCEKCIRNQYGTASTGNGKACRNTIRLAVVPADCNESTTPMILRAAPSSIKLWSAYVAELEQFDKHPLEVQTLISFDPHAAYPKLNFKASGEVEDLELIMALRKKAQTYLDQVPMSNKD